MPAAPPTQPERRPAPPAAWAALAAAALLVACSSPPQRARPPVQALPAPLPPAAGDSRRDGPPANPPPGLADVPDAVPQPEQPRAGGPNKPYAVLGQAYTPLLGDPPVRQRGLASWYGRQFHGRPTANGETYNMYAMTAAHKTMPLPSYARVRNPANNREVVVRVNDRGPFHSDRVIDLSYTAALRLGVLGGVAPVEIERITNEAIRSGSWRPPGTAVAAAPGAVDAVDDPIDELLQRSSAARSLQIAPGVAALPAAPAPPASPPAPPPPPEPLPPETAAPAQAAAQAAPGFWLQLGAFARADGALGFQRRVAAEADWLAPLLAVFNERSLHRLQAGPYASRAQAQAAAQRLRDALQLLPVVVERR